jgi:drug/metabolite transporter (DMT)-like permease
MRISIFQSPERDNPVSAVGLLVAGVFVLAFQDALVKVVSSDTSYWQFQTLRSLGNMSIAVVLAFVGGGLALLRPRKTGAVYLRATFLTTTMFCFFGGAPFLDIAQMAAGLYTYPIFLTLLAAPVLGEKVGRWRLGAVALGATGALAVLDPWTLDFQWLQMLPMAAGFFYACNILTLRRACRNESPLALAFAVAVTMLASGVLGILVLGLNPPPDALVIGIPFLATAWPELSFYIVAVALMASVFNLAGNICLSRAYQTADASLLAPLDFVYLLFAAIWGRILFDNWPDAQALAGLVLIASAGALTTWREQVRRRGTLIEHEVNGQTDRLTQARTRKRSAASPDRRY